MFNQEKVSLPEIPTPTQEKLHFIQTQKNPTASSKSCRCFICKKKGHFARNCPNGPSKSVRLIKHLQGSLLLSDNDGVESFFLEQEDYDEQTAFVLAEDHSDPESVSIIQTIQQIQKTQPVTPILSIKIHLLLEKFDKPISVIGFIDTGAPKSMLNLSIMPSHFWEKHEEYFRAANGELFQTNLITKKPVGIQFFPNCVLWIKIIGSNLSDKDILIGFDILHLIKNLHITASRIRYKQMFQLYTDILRLFSISNSPPSYDSFKNRFLPFCLENHS